MSNIFLEKNTWVNRRFYDKIIVLMITNAVNPGSPSNPAMDEVNKLIGMCSPKLVPKAFTKKRSTEPIITFIKILPNHFKGLKGAPTIRRRNNRPMIPTINTEGSNYKPPSCLYRLLILMNMKYLLMFRTSSYSKTGSLVPQIVMI